MEGGEGVCSLQQATRAMVVLSAFEMLNYLFY